ncbi:ABC transporter permease [Conexibacter sp. CPCC 206217]|uniref:ABC transporter permease n=1 Tax=Conexibacter sp. CPCC 206217 TaxID=3064574 RepID=UPI00271707C1|nr:ABC transporter permease [Conexibacter sp. CPCC 206217]MDO8212141.1 ABC transporter permease [Conexibacter sp. CPCC 206217]
MKIQSESLAPPSAARTRAPVATGAPRRRHRRRFRVPAGIQRLAGPLLLLLAWQAGSSLGAIDPQTLASPSAVISASWALIESGELPKHLWVSLGRAMLGLAIGVAVGTVAALVSGLSRIGENMVDGPMQMFRTMPVTATIPLLIVWFGIGETPKIAMVAIATTFPIYLNLLGGIRAVDRRLVEAMQTFGLGQAALIRHVVLPSALPSFLVGLRYSLGIAWVVLVISEQINATSGIGYLMIDAQQYFRTDVIVVGLIVYSLLGLASDVIVRVIERRALDWRASLGTDR